jgi:beta-barrel assembly-enhancing protease
MSNIAKISMICAMALSLNAFDFSSLGAIGDAVGGTGNSKLDSALKVVSAASKASEDITPEQEYYIGRAVSATILSKYKLYNNKKLTDYVSKIGTLLSMNSKMPYTYDGYSFALLDSEEINAFAAPSGMIFVTKGMLRLCDSEDALAAVLAHEIAHVQNRHGIKSIEKSRVTSLLTTVATEGAKQYGNKDTAKLTTIFQDSISDIVGTMVTSGYSKTTEFEADKDAIEILTRTGYRSDKIVVMLENMKKGLKEHSGGFGATHPSPDERIGQLKTALRADQPSIPSVRTSRFSAEIKKL